LPSIVFEQAVVGAALDAYRYSYPPVLLLLLTTPLALMAHVPGLLAWLAAGWCAFYRALRLAMPGQGPLLLALAAPGGFHQRGRRTEQHLDGGAVRRRLEPARATAAARPAITHLSLQCAPKRTSAERA
jgi:hypothetical protein